MYFIWLFPRRRLDNNLNCSKVRYTTYRKSILSLHWFQNIWILERHYGRCQCSKFELGNFVKHKSCLIWFSSLTEVSFNSTFQKYSEFIFLSTVFPWERWQAPYVGGDSVCACVSVCVCLGRKNKFWIFWNVELKLTSVRLENQIKHDLSLTKFPSSYFEHWHRP